MEEEKEDNEKEYVFKVELEEPIDPDALREAVQDYAEKCVSIVELCKETHFSA